MPDLTPNHPAVEAAARSAYERAWCGENEPWSEVDDLERDEWRADEAHSLTAALPHLTADDLRGTPAGQALIAEGRGWTPTTERDRRALAILNDPTVPETTWHALANAMRFLHKLERMTGR